MCSSYHFLSPLVTISLFFVLVHFYFVDKFICSSFKIACIRGFPESSVVKESTCNAGDPSLIPESGRSPGEGNGCPLQCSGLENSMDCIVHGVAKSRARLSSFHLDLVCLSRSAYLEFVHFVRNYQSVGLHV